MSTPYHVKIAPNAQRQIKTLLPKQQKLSIKYIEALAINPRPPGAVKMEGMMGLYRQEANEVHLIYKIEEQDILLLAVK